VTYQTLFWTGKFVSDPDQCRILLGKVGTFFFESDGRSGTFRLYKNRIRDCYIGGSKTSVYMYCVHYYTALIINHA
jgi:hypothetical protein